MASATSTPDASFEAPLPPRKPRRVSTFCSNASPGRQSKPFSKSAAKRDSVMALGSIEHLQQYFAKTGLVQKRRSHYMNKMLVPALGPSVIPTVHVSETPTIDVLPPTPAPPVSNHPVLPAPKRAPLVDPEALKPGVIRDLDAVEKAWGIGIHSKSRAALGESAEAKGPALLTAANVKRSAGDFFDVLAVLQVTTRTIRSVRSYLVSLPDEHTSEQIPHRDEPVAASLRKHSQSRQRASLAGNTPTPLPFPSRPPDRLTRIRSAALEVLAALRVIEESSRIPLSDDAYDGLSVGSGIGEVPISMSEEFLGSSGRSSTAGDRSNSLFSGDEDDNDSMTSASNSGAGVSGFTTIRVVQKRGSVGVIHVWSDGEEEDELREPDEKKETWDDRLVLGGGWLYRQVQLSSLTREREVVAHYLAIVDEVLFGGASSTATSIAHSRETSTISEEEEVTGEIYSIIDQPIPRTWRSVKLQKPPRRVSSRSSLGGLSTSPPETPASRMSPEPFPRKLGATGLMDAFRDVVLPHEAPNRSLQPGDTSFGLQEEEEENTDEEGESEEGGELPDEELPDWARRDKFDRDPMGRLHSILLETLPTEYTWLLPPPSDREEFLARLSDGQLLCTSYNATVKRSEKPWGFIGNTSIHDLIGLEEKEKQREATAQAKEKKVKSAWTFRRTENLRLWAAALKLRYLIPLSPNDAPSSPPASPNTHAIFATNPLFSPPSQHANLVPNRALSPPPKLEALLPTPSKVLASMGPAIHFDPKVVAKKDDGWETMLDDALTRWVEVIVREKREKPRRR